VLAIISISLGVLNLLPIPVLDGGHLVFYLIEAIKGSPLSAEAQANAQQVGMFMIFSLMFLAFFNDLTRLFG
jgi:regulator of sigma E protease